MPDSHDTSSPAFANTAAIILPIAAMVLAFSLILSAILMVWLRVALPGFFRRNMPRREGILPTTEAPSHNKWMDGNPVSRRARAAALWAGKKFDPMRGRVAGLLDDRGRRRCSDLPIMHQQSWQLLAESHTELALVRSKGDDNKAERETIQVVEKSKKAGKKTVRFDLGDEENEEQQPHFRKPEPAVVAGEKFEDGTANWATGRVVFRCSLGGPVDRLVVVGTTRDLLDVRHPGCKGGGRNTIG